MTTLLFMLIYFSLKKKNQHSPIYFTSYLSVFQEQEENKSATSWPEYYIDQLNLMAAVSTFLLG